MPTYLYECKACGLRYDAVQSVADRNLSPECPKCLTRASEKRVTTVRLDSRMGLDPDFPTAYKKWGDSQRKRATGQMKDSNNPEHDPAYYKQ